MASAYRLRGYATLDELLSDEPDLVFVHAPTAAHVELVSACLAAGTGVYVDKPLAQSLAECEDLVAQGDRSGRLLAVGFNRRFAPMYVRARDWLAERGAVTYAIMEKHRAAVYDQSPRQAVFDDLIHVLDTLCWLLGPDAEPGSSQVRIDDAGRFMVGTGAVQTRDAYAAYAMVRSAGADLERLALHGAGRSAEVVDLERATLDGGGEPRQVAVFGSWDTVARRRGFDALIGHVLGTAGSPHECDVAASRVLAAHRIAEAIAAAAEG